MTKKKKTNKKTAAKKKSKKDVCFTIMPFKEPFDTYFATIISPAIEDAGLEPIRGDSVFMSSSIVGDIWKKTQEAKVIIAELTDKNANVFYELGLAHAIGKPVILISEKIDDVPFDLRNYRVITYDKNNPAWGDELHSKIIEFLKATVSEPIEAVPTMFRKIVKSQAPSESEISLRLTELEKKVDSIKQVSSYRGREMINSPSDAEKTMRLYFKMGLPPERIIDKLVRRGVPEDWIVQRISDYIKK